MNHITSLEFDNTYASLPADFYDIVKPTPFKSPFIIAVNPDAASLIDLDVECDYVVLAEYLSGKREIPDSRPVAMYYTGHQFGVYNRDIGDGRAILLGEVRDKSGVTWDVHLKGAGRTKFSRQFDGRAVLRSTIREYLCSEAMHGLGIPTTRALCIIGGEETVQREKAEPAAMMIRLAKSHVRFGSFEAFYYSGKHDGLQILADYMIKHHYPGLDGRKDKYDRFLFEIAGRTARLIANWQAAGFTHGVMNTDNMSVIGDTLDYGPFGFIDRFRFQYVPNHSDHFGRYSYVNQPGTGLWNISKLITSLDTLVTGGIKSEVLEEYKTQYMTEYLELMARKLGFSTFREGDKNFVEDTLNLLENEDLDYTLFFRNLSDAGKRDDRNRYDEILKPEKQSRDIEQWFNRYRLRLSEEDVTDEERKLNMDRINPLYILRNYLAENAINKAEQGDYSEIENLRILLKDPYSEKEGMEFYSQEPPEWGRDLVLSCSS